MASRESAQAAPRTSSARHRLDVARDTRAVSTEDLLAVVVGREDSARRLVEVAGENGLGLLVLSQAPDGLRRQWGGLTDAQGARLTAALELGRRLSNGQTTIPTPFTKPAEVARYLVAKHGNGGQEEFGLLCLTSRGSLIRDVVLARGSATGCPVHPRDLFRQAIAVQAVSLIVWHNHPSGDPEPSQADRQLTRRLKEAGALIGIPVLDHFVIGAGGRFFSFSKAGEM